MRQAPRGLLDQLVVQGHRVLVDLKVREVQRDHPARAVPKVLVGLLVQPALQDPLGHRVQLEVQDHQDQVALRVLQVQLDRVAHQVPRGLRVVLVLPVQVGHKAQLGPAAPKAAQDQVGHQGLQELE